MISKPLLFLLIAFPTLLLAQFDPAPYSNIFQTKTSNELIYAKPFYIVNGNTETSEKKSLLLDVVGENESTDSMINHLNHYYYNQLPHHFMVSDQLAPELAPYVGFTAKTEYDFSTKWPFKLSETQYNLLKDRLGIDFTQRLDIKDELKGKYVIIPNLDFWDYQYREEYNMLIDILSTYERFFDDFEIIHETAEEALNYGVIISSRFCSSRGPDNIAYYTQLLQKEIAQLENPLKAEMQNIDLGNSGWLNTLNYDVTVQGKEAKKAMYTSIMNEDKEEFNLHRSMIRYIKNPPFHIIHLK